jgi:hypothetical protein
MHSRTGFIHLAERRPIVPAAAKHRDTVRFRQLSRPRLRELTPSMSRSQRFHGSGQLEEVFQQKLFVRRHPQTQKLAEVRHLLSQVVPQRAVIGRSSRFPMTRVGRAFADSCLDYFSRQRSLTPSNRPRRLALTGGDIRLPNTVQRPLAQPDRNERLAAAKIDDNHVRIATGVFDHCAFGFIQQRAVISGKRKLLGAGNNSQIACLDEQQGDIRDIGHARAVADARTHDTASEAAAPGHHVEICHRHAVFRHAVDRDVAREVKRRNAGG